MPVTDLQWLFTDRLGGVSDPPFDSLNLAGHVGDDPAAVDLNRQRLAASLGVSNLVWMNQVHGDRVAVVREVPAEPPTCDAVVTDVPGLALAVLCADCVPVLMADHEAGVVAAAHAGREGVRLSVVLRTLEAMEALGAAPERIHVRMGPAICGSCYEVPLSMQQTVTAVAPDAGSTTRRGTPGLDLRVGLAGLLADRVAAVSVDPICTYESRDHFSFRRDATTGRIAGAVRLIA